MVRHVYATGDPFRWSPVTVEMLLADWFPRKIIAEPSYLAKLPDLLRAYIRYSHDRNGIRGDLTEETLAAVDQYEKEYLQLIRVTAEGDGRRSVEAMLESERIDAPQRRRDPPGAHRREVGGVDALMGSTPSRFPMRSSTGPAFLTRSVRPSGRSSTSATRVRSDPRRRAPHRDATVPRRAAATTRRCSTERAHRCAAPLLSRG